MKQILKSLDYPKLTRLEFAARVPFYLNMICLGYVYYWSRKEPMRFIWGELGGWYHVAVAGFIFSGFIAFAVAVPACLRARRHWPWAVVYTGFSFWFFVKYIFLPVIQQPLFPVH